MDEGYWFAVVIRGVVGRCAFYDEVCDWRGDADSAGKIVDKLYLTEDGDLGEGKI